MKKICLFFSVGVVIVLGSMMLLCMSRTRQCRGIYQNYTVSIEEKLSPVAKNKTVVFLFPLNDRAQIQGMVTACFEESECISLSIDKPYKFSAIPLVVADPSIHTAVRIAEAARMQIQNNNDWY